MSKGQAILNNAEPWQEVWFFGDNGFYSKRYIPHPLMPNHYKEQINLGHGWETICYLVDVKKG